jgi:phosphoribosylformylglycinamidine cyclo-ligase
MANKYFEEVVNPGDRASRLAKQICFQSHKNCPAVIVVPHQPNNFRGPVGFVWKWHILEQMMGGVMLEEMETDGAGGKPQFFTLLGAPQVFSNLGWEIIAMNADDFARSGRLPCVIANELNVKRVSEKNFPLFTAAMEGYGAALRQAGLVNITGETAIMRHSITAFCDVDSDEQLVLTWGGTCIGLAHKDLLIDGSGIEPNMIVIGFWEPGYRCNGGTLFTNLIRDKWGPSARDIMRTPEALEFVQKLTVPSKSYARTIARLVGWNPDGSIGEPLARIKGIAHVTGGGVWGKFGELLPQGVGAFLSCMPEPADVLLQAQKLSLNTTYPLTDWQAYGTLHGGCGMLIVADKGSELAIIREAKKDGVTASVVGFTFPSPHREIIIQSKFKEGKQLSSLKPE